MVGCRRLVGLLLAIASARAGASPDSLGSDLSILINNDLLESQSPHRDSGVLLLDATGFTNARQHCAALGESLWGDEAPFSQIKPNLVYLVYQGRYSPSQRYWIAPDRHQKPQTIDRKGSIRSASARDQYPVLCTQTAPYSNETYQDTSSKYQATVRSNNEHITGFRDRLAFRFLGIRYAEQPKRWTYSQLYKGSGGAASALEYGSSCVQGGDTDSEDCLFLNIWTPYIPNPQSKHHGKTNLKPVMLWIHGGAFTNGANSDPTFDGANLAARGDVVVIAINYRLGTLGFLALDDGETNGNYGLADQITALDWVQKHIRDFGGDPDRVTIFGQSAGAGSVRALLASPKARGKFSAAIMQSNLGGLAYGTTYSKYYTIAEQMEAAGTAVLEATNCTTVDCLRELPLSTVAPLSWMARYLVVDGTYLLHDELDLTNPSSTASVPLMIGLMRDDGAAMIGYPSPSTNLSSFISSSGLPPSVLSSNPALFPVPNTANKTLDIFNTTSHLATDGIFRCIDQATAYAAQKNGIFPSIYFYEFNRSYQMPGWSPNPPLCEAPRTPAHPAGDPSKEYFKCHSGELYYVFGTLRRVGLPLRDEFDLPFGQLVLDSWASFARTGDPNPAKGFLGARGYTNTAKALERGGIWRKFEEGRHQVSQLQWPAGLGELIEGEQCEALGLGLDYYLNH